MYWTLELASKLEDAPWPATKDELVDYAIRSGSPLEVSKTCKKWKTREKFTKVSKIFGPTIQAKKISSLTKKNINRKSQI